MNNVICLLSVVLLMISGKHAAARDSYHTDSLFEHAKKENKTIFMHFSGSDWCANCIRFEKQVLNDSSFQQYLTENMIYLSVDFPQRNKQTTAEKKQNEALAEQYNPKGIFPAIVLISPQNSMVTILYQQETAMAFLQKTELANNSLKALDGTQD
jgi:thioredoxin-related protein